MKLERWSSSFFKSHKQKQNYQREANLLNKQKNAIYLFEFVLLGKKTLFRSAPIKLWWFQIFPCMKTNKSTEFLYENSYNKTSCTRIINDQYGGSDLIFFFSLVTFIPMNQKHFA